MLHLKTHFAYKYKFLFSSRQGYTSGKMKLNPISSTRSVCPYKLLKRNKWYLKWGEKSNGKDVQIEAHTLCLPARKMSIYLQ